MIICVNNNKGGSLKTTVCTNFAGVLAKKGKKVLIVDSDNQGNVALTFGRNPDTARTTLYDVLVDGVPAEDAITNVYKNIDVLPANAELISFEFDVLRNMKRFPEPFILMDRELNHLRKYYDYILIDTPPSLGVMNGNVFAFADKVIIPYIPEPYSMRSLIQVVKTINSFKKEFNPNLEILGIIPVLVNLQTTLHQDIIQKTNVFADKSDIRIFDTYIPRSVQFAKSINDEMLPATLAKKKRRDDKAELYYSLWEEIESILEGSAE